MNIGVVDIETTGFFPRGNIVEIGIASLDTETGEVKTVFNSVCRELGMDAGYHDAWIFKNSDLTVKEVEKSPLLEDLKPEIQHILDGFVAITAYNKRFDFTFLRDRGFAIDSEWPCPMLVATNVCKLPGRRRNGSSYKWPKVQEAWDFFFPEIPYVEEHRGADDAAHEAKIIHALCLLGLMPVETEIEGKENA